MGKNSYFVPLGEINEAYKVAISPFNERIIYACSSQVLFKTENRGETWRKLLVIKEGEITSLFLDEFLFDRLYLSSNRHLYRIDKERIKKIYSAPDEEEILCIALFQGKIYLGTSEGAYYSQEDFLHWKKLRGLPSSLKVFYWAFSSPSPQNSYFYALTSRGLYFSSDGEHFTRVFSLREGEEEEEQYFTLYSLKADIVNPKKVYLATSQGLFFSSDYGAAWKKLFLSGLESFPIHDLAQNRLEKDILYLATEKGLFRLNLKTLEVKNLYQGLPTNLIYKIDFDTQGRLFVATKKGLFQYLPLNSSSSFNELHILLEKEPSIREVQEAALRYNEVHPEKIERWRRALKYRALFPSISLDYDKTIGYSVSRYGEYFSVGPRDWGITFSWDVGDLIWNPYEDDVDTRSRLNTQLRLDILDEINRVYFERLRLKRKLLTLKDKEKRLQMELRLKELEAILDGYTGGYFSRARKD